MATPFIAELLRDLRDAVRALKKENKELETGIAAAENAAQDAVQKIEQKCYEEVNLLFEHLEIFQNFFGLFIIL